MTRPVRLNKIRDAIAAALWANTKSYELPAVCKRYGLEVVDDDEARLSAHRSKTVFVNTHTTSLTLPQLITLANKILEDYECPELEALINQSGAQGVAGEFRNLIFAANGPKPKIIFRDAINNDIKVIENAKYCLIYNKPLGAHGLTWDELVLWWMALNGRIGDKNPAGRTLYSQAEHVQVWFAFDGANIDLRPGGTLVHTWKEHGSFRNCFSVSSHRRVNRRIAVACCRAAMLWR